jgi:hypothetical protein
VWWSVTVVRVCVCVSGRESVFVCVTSSSAHLTPPCWRLSLIPEGNSPLQFYILHFTNINHSLPWTDNPFFQQTCFCY